MRRLHGIICMLLLSYSSRAFVLHRATARVCTSLRAGSSAQQTRTAVVTGANGGIGLQLCDQLLKQGYQVYACYRKDKQRIDQQLTSPHLQPLQVDVTCDDSILRLVSVLKSKGHLVDVLINNSGVFTSEGVRNIDFDLLSTTFDVNALGPLRLSVALLKAGLICAPGGKIAMITSRMGSMSDNTSGGSYAYRMSKAALNAASVSLALDLRGSGISVGVIHPGWVRTKMTDFSGHMDPSEAARLILARVSDMDTNNSGTFWHANGQVLPW